MKDKKQVLRIVSVLIMLPALLIFTLMPWLNEKNDRLGSIENLKRIHMALTSYADGANGNLPEKAGVNGFNQLSSKTAKHYLAPLDKTSEEADGASLKERNTSYAYVGAGLVNSPELAKYPMVIEKPWLTKDPHYIILFSGEVIASENMPEINKCEDFIRHLSQGETSPTWNKLLENARAVDQACGR